MAAKPPKVLFFTFSEHGQANTILATVSALLTRKEGVSVHIASFAPLKKHIDGFNFHECSASSLLFHPVEGITHLEASTRAGVSEKTIISPPTTRSSKPLEMVVPVMFGWTDDEYRVTMDSCKNIINTVDPDAIVVDAIFQQAHDACTLLGRTYIVSCCMPAITAAAQYQPYGKSFWHYPAIASDTPYPIPKRSILPNIWRMLRFAFVMMTHPRMRACFAFRKEMGLPVMPPGFMFHADKKYISVSLPELDYPLVKPEKMTLCGPIIPPTSPLPEADPELQQWLDRGKTIIMVMGTHFHYEKGIVEGVLRAVLDGLPPDDSMYQLLWKVPNIEEVQDLLQPLTEAYGDRVKIVKWLEPAVVSVLLHPNVTCFIHHGGANSFFEAAYCGVPQIILAQWFDLYENAARVEYLGIGIYGNRTDPPSINPTELATAVARVTRPGTESECLHQKAAELGRLARVKEGRETAAEVILNTVREHA